MARVALALCLLLALAAARAAPSDYAWSEEQAVAAAAEAEEVAAAAELEEERAGREAAAEAEEVAAAAELAEERAGREAAAEAEEVAAAEEEVAAAAELEEERAGREAAALDEEQWQGEEDNDAAVYEEQQEGYQQRANSEPLTQQLEDSQVVQDSDEGTLSRLTSEAQGEQQFEQQAGQLQQSHQQLQQQTQQNEGLPDRLVNPTQNATSGYNPSRERGRDDFGFVGGNGGVQQQQPPSSDRQQFPGSSPPQRPGPGQTTPPAGYTQLGFFGYFKVYQTPVTWPEALMTCFADGAQLVVPSDEREARTIGQLYGKVKNQVKKSTDKDLFFIGASDVHKENSFVTILGTTFGKGQWARWQKGEPNNHKKVEHCVLSNDQGFYWDGNCQNKYAFVCQFKDRCLPGSPRSDEFRDQTQSQTRY